MESKVHIRLHKELKMNHSRYVRQANISWYTCYVSRVASCPDSLPSAHLLYSGYFSGGQIFVAFIVERRTTKFLPKKWYRIVPGCGLVYHDHENFTTNWPKIYCSQKFYPLKYTRYTVFLYHQRLMCALGESLGPRLQVEYVHYTYM